MAAPIESTFVKPRPVRILIVDDDVGNGALVTRLLEVAGYQAEQSINPMKAIPLLRGGEFSLVLLDQNMPGMDGLTLLEEIRKESNVPVVMLTGSDKSALAVRAIRLGAFDYLTKPVEELRLIQTVRQAIESDSGAGSRIAHYEVQGEVGRGGMGVVYAARDPRLDRKVALKVLLPEFAADPAYELKFLGEARAAAKFSHPNIVTVYEAGRFRGRLFMAMEFVQGEPLENFVRAGTPLPLVRVLDIGVQVSTALEALHAAGMIHRDLKPSNLIMTTGSTVKVLDFGLVRPADPLGPDAKDDVSGTLSYAPPEILIDGTADARGDIYALGVVLFELLSGSRAFESRSITDLVHRITEGRSGMSLDGLAEVPKEAVDLLRAMMALKPADRPATMGEVRASLQTLRRISGDRRTGRR